MSVRQIRRKLEAWDAGQPIPRYSTIHHAATAPDNTMIVAFVRMAGESRPWGIAWGRPGETPTIESVPDGRVRDDVAVLSATFAESLLEHLRVHNWTYDPLPEKPESRELRQVWVPNGQHVAMLHQLNYAYSQTKFGGANQDILRALGRVAGWLFRESARKGSQHIVNASAALSEAFAFPAQDARTAHLGYQLAWLLTEGDRQTRLDAAAAAELQAVSPTMNPSVEQDELSDLVEKWQRADRAGSPDAGIAVQIETALAAEASRRWMLCEAAYEELEASERPTNPGVAGLIDAAHKEFWYQHQRIELNLSDPTQGPAFVAHPETDFHGSAAASRYLVHAAADEAYVGQLIHDDVELYEEAVDDGRAFEGRVVDVRDLGSDRIRRPVWTVALDPSRPHRLREGGRLAPYGSRGHEVTVLELRVESDDLLVSMEWTSRKTRALSCGIAAKPVDLAWIGEDLRFVVSDAASLTAMRSQRVWKAKDGPGAWLTHGRSPAAVEIDEDAATTVRLVDDIEQIEDGAST